MGEDGSGSHSNAPPHTHHMYSGHILLELGRPNEALIEYLHVRSLKPTHPPTHQLTHPPTHPPRRSTSPDQQKGERLGQ